MTIEQTRRLLSWISKLSDVNIIGLPHDELLAYHARTTTTTPLYRDKQERELFSVYLKKDISFSPSFDLTVQEIGSVRLLVAQENLATLAVTDRKLLCKQFARSWAILYAYHKQRSLEDVDLAGESTDIFSEIDQHHQCLESTNPQVLNSVKRTLQDLIVQSAIVKKIATKARPRAIPQPKRANPQSEKKVVSRTVEKKTQTESDDAKLLLEMKGIHQVLKRLRSI